MAGSAIVRTMTGMAVGVLAVGALAVGASYAQQPVQARGQMAMRGRGTMPAGPLGAMRLGLGQLRLSDEQKRQIASIFQGKKTAFRTFRQQMRQARRGVANAVANDEGEAAIRARSAELASVQADLVVFRAELRRQVLGVLTPEQQARAKQLRLEAQKRFGDGR